MASFPVGELAVKDASAGTGYIDAQGKWHFSVVFLQPEAGPQIDENFWLTVLQTADTLLYQATAGKHQFGTITIMPQRRYSSTADLIIWREEERSFADVYGINRAGYHIYMSDQLHDPGRTDRYGVRDLAKLLVHELGHYLYAVYDEYRTRDNFILPRDFQCIYSSYRNNLLDQAACLMEDFGHAGGTWCFNENHEALRSNIQLSKTWQSQDNNKMSCWSTMKRLYPSFWSPLDQPQLPQEVPLSRLTPFNAVKLGAQAEFVVAVDASILPSSEAESVMFQMLDRAFISNPDDSGRVILLKYNQDSTQAAAPVRWETDLAFNYERILNSLTLRRDKPNANLTALLQQVLNAFEALAGGPGRLGGTSRTFLLITSGKESPAVPDSVLLARFRSQNIRTTIGFVRSTETLAGEVLETYRRLAAGMGGAVYDATFPSVMAYQATDAAGKQIIAVRTLPVDSSGNFDYTAPDDIQEVIASASWPDPTCKVSVIVLRNGVGDTVAAGNANDFVGHTLKARRYFRLTRGEKLQVQVMVPAGCIKIPLPVTIAISDEKPKAFLVAVAERTLYGSQDNQVIHARVNAPYPLVNLDELATGKINFYGDFLNDVTEGAFDDGVDSVRIRSSAFNGDWAKGDGIYSKIFKGAAGGLRTVRLQATNLGQAILASGEEFMIKNTDPLNPIPKFRREAFVTYFVKAAQNSTLDLPGFQLDKLPWSTPLPRTELKFTVTGNFKLPPDYPHAFSIEIGGAVNGKTVKFDSVKIEANTLQANLNFKVCDIFPELCSFPPKVPAGFVLESSLTVRYRSGDTASVKLSLLVPVEDHRANTNNLPTVFRLYPNFPNPFNLATRIVFDTPKREKISLAIYDVIGRKIRTLIAEKSFEPGTHEIAWDGRTGDGAIAGSGVYFMRLRAGGRTQVQKIVLAK
jgi:hypothetical protein